MLMVVKSMQQALHQQRVVAAKAGCNAQDRLMGTEFLICLQLRLIHSKLDST